MKNFLKNLKNNIGKIFQRKSVQIFLITFVIHMIVVGFFFFVPINLFKNEIDHIFYFETGTQIAELIKQGAYHFGDVYPHHWFPLFIGVIYYLFGSTMTVGVVVNAVLSAISAVLFYKILKESAVSEKNSFWGTVVVFNGYASFMYHSSVLLKEAMALTLLLGIIYLSLCMIQGKINKVIAFGIFLVLFTLSRSLRFFIGFAGAAGFFISWFVSAKDVIKKKILTGLGMIMGTLLVGIMVQGVPLISGVTLISSLNPNLIYVTRIYSSKNANTATHTAVFKRAEEGSQLVQMSGIKETVQRSEQENIRYTFSVGGFLKTLLTTIFGPFPGQLSFGKYLMLFMDVVFVYGVLGFLIWGIIKMKWEHIKIIFPWMVVAGGIVLAVALGTDNIGAMIRQRIPAVIVGALIAIYVYDKRIHGK